MDYKFQLLDEAITFLKLHWQDVKDFFNSGFFTAIVGSLAGAFAGAYGAQVIAERSKKREELLKEIRNTNAATMIAFSICNSLLGLKSQHVKSLKETHDAQAVAILEHQRKRQKGQIPLNIGLRYQADFQTLSLPPLPIEILQKQVFEKLSLNGRPLGLTTILSQTVHNLHVSLEKRNQLIETYKASSLTQEQLVVLYFGLPHDGGHINNDYPSSIDAIYTQTDDGIYFSQLLCKDLVDHGEHIASQFKKDFGKDAPNVNKPDFAKAVESGLMPKDEDYTDWTKMFVKKTGP